MDSRHVQPGLLYFADGGLGVYNLWDPFSPEQLVRYVDDFADNGVGILSQMVFTGGTTKPGLFRPEHPDLTWWPDERLRDLIEPGSQPLDMLIRRAHQRGLQFFAKLRMSDWHEHRPEDRPFITAHPELHNPSWPTRPVLDYTHASVRQYHLAVIDELLRRFDIDGITLNFIRGWYCFPQETGRGQHAVLTEFVRQIRRCLDEYGRSRGQKLALSVIVLPSFDLCEALGYDVTRWVEEGLINYLSCGNGHYTDPNLDHQPWSRLCEDSDCRYFPMSGPVSGHPTALGYLREVGDPLRLDEGPRHYWFRPLGMTWKADGRSYDDNYRVTLPRRVGARGEYRFRLPEDLARCGRCELFVHVLGLHSTGSGPQDQVMLAVNGVPIPSRSIRRVFYTDGRLEQFGAPLPPYTSFWFELTAPPARCGQNRLAVELAGVELTGGGADAGDTATLEEVEVVVMPRPVDRRPLHGRLSRNKVL